jgi:hypothetical protein
MSKLLYKSELSTVSHCNNNAKQNNWGQIPINSHLSHYKFNWGHNKIDSKKAASIMAFEPFLDFF